MQWKNSTLAFVVAALAGFSLNACGPDGTGGTTAVGGACTADADCKTDLVCHKTANVCVETCSITADCDQDSTQKNCIAAPWASSGADAGSSGAKICGCSTDALCGTGKICYSGTTEICRDKCTADGQCNGGTCNTTTGKCSGGTMGTTCNQATTTIGTSGGPDTCAYGDLCGTASSCVAAPVGTCTEGSTAPTWNKAAKAAPVIRAVTAVGSATSNTTTECGDGLKKTVFTIQYYAPTAFLNSTTFATYKPQIKFRFTGNWVEPSFEAQMPTSGQTYGEIKVGVCGRDTGPGAVYITAAGDATKSSNVVCATW